MAFEGKGSRREAVRQFGEDFLRRHEAFGRVVESNGNVTLNSVGVQLHPVKFHLAFSGVLTVAFEGFPEAVERLKADLETAVVAANENRKDAEGNLIDAKEGLGSRWCKATIGALHGQPDGSPPVLSDAHLNALREVCSRHSAELLSKVGPVEADSVSVVEYRNRALTERAAVQTVPFRLSPDAASNRDAVSPGMKVLAVSIMDDVEKNEGVARGAYAPQMLPFKHYATPASGVCLVMDLLATPEQQKANVSLLGALKEFRAAVDEALGEGCMGWIPDEAVHSTIRALCS